MRYHYCVSALDGCMQFILISNKWTFVPILDQNQLYVQAKMHIFRYKVVRETLGVMEGVSF